MAAEVASKYRKSVGEKPVLREIERIVAIAERVGGDAY